jgi:hypothetical protein
MVSSYVGYFASALVLGTFLTRTMIIDRLARDVEAQRLEAAAA